MKTILHVIDTTGPGGAETVFIDLATRLPPDTYRSLALIRGKGWVCEELRRRGVEPIVMDAKGSFNRRFLAGLCRLVRTEHVDLLQSHLLGSNVYCALAGLLTRTPLVATFHGSVDIGARERFVGLKCRVINAGAGCIVAVTDSLRSDLVDRTPLDPGKLRVIQNGIDTARFRRTRGDTLRRQYGWAETDFIIGSVGNIRPAKGYDILLRTAALLKNSTQTYRFVIAGQGKGGLYDELLALHKELGLEDSVRFAGFLDDVPEFLAGIDLFLSSSISEGLPLSAIQAMVASLPVIATRCGGYEQLISDRVNGWLVEVGNPQALAEAIETVAANAGLRARLAEDANRHAVAAFDIGVMLKAYQQEYDRLLRDASR